MLIRVDRYINYQTRACATTTGYFIFVWFRWKVQVANTEPVPVLSFLLWETARTHEILAARGEQMLRNMCDDPRLGWYEKLPRHQLVMRGAWQNKHKGLYNGYHMMNMGRKFYQKL